MENTNCYIFAFATFGHPNDFRQTPFKYGNPEIAKQVKVFDLSNAIKVFPNSTIYSIRKESIRSSKLISYSIYSFAQEQASKRDGTFIGSSIILENAIAEEQYVLNCLNEFHQKLTENNLDNNVLKVNHSKDFIPISNLRDFDKIKNPQFEIANLNFNANNDSLVVYCDTSPSKLAAFFNKSIDLLNIYDVIYFTNSEEVAKFVIQKGIFKLIQNVGEKREFERELSALQEERKRKRQQLILAFESEIQTIIQEKENTIQAFKNAIEKNERLHKENEIRLQESKESIAKIESFYNDFLRATEGLQSNSAEAGYSLHDIKISHNKNKDLFNKNIGELKGPAYITEISNPKPKSNLPVQNEIEGRIQSSLNHLSPIPKTYTNQEDGFGYEENKRLSSYSFLNLSILFLGVLLLFTVIYFLFLDKKPKPQIPLSQDTIQVQETSIPVSSQPKEILSELVPTSNSELSQADYRNVAKYIKSNNAIGEVVKIIFDKNPGDVKSYYVGQESLYEKHLLQLNKECFELKDGTYYFKSDTLRHIPCYKKI